MKQTGKETAVITTPTARVTAARLAIRAARPRRLTGTLLWAAQILLAAFFLFVAALPHLAGSHQAVQEFGQIGAGQWLRYLVGTTELAGAIGLLTPWLAGLAAAGLAAEMAGATIINATVLHNTTFGSNVWLTLPLCAVFVLIAYGRRQQIKGLAAAIRGNGRPTGPQLTGSDLPIPGDADGLQLRQGAPGGSTSADLDPPNRPRAPRPAGRCLPMARRPHPGNDPAA